MNIHKYFRERIFIVILHYNFVDLHIRIYVLCIVNITVMESEHMIEIFPVAVNVAILIYCICSDCFPAFLYFFLESQGAVRNHPYG